ncbi:transporter substrate-binding domain-containing protein [Catenovulum sp. 2E275]|uniref:transporter substrate-binding domain-containing protein n=1 Tax=Catenovulum sp. 2E275 TaxID=2980497 RepID=UPI0021D245DC|nr:transporter substrate-binding domain-containing protein [Catenovulum sp. 2E275]MCU4677381.1 transporter substrate-binding domain-containing protein [Catenovulum sp. 2E275]
MLLKCRYGLIILFAWSHLSFAAVDVITNKKSNAASNYMTGLLELALSYSTTDYQLKSTDEVLSKSRVLESLKTGTIHVTWGGTSEQLEQDYIPIRIDTYRGLMSHRLMFIRQNDQARFNQIKTPEDLQNIKFGQGRRWQDTKILEASGLTVIKSNKKQNLYYMLDGGRFDAFPRGASEALIELNDYPDLPLTVEQNLVIIYPLPTYFFVSKKHPQLAKDLEFGMEAILKDGKFDEYFYNSPEIKSTLERANLKNRRAIRLDNPFLPKATPLHRKELWLDLTAD